MFSSTISAQMQSQPRRHHQRAFQVRMCPGLPVAMRVDRIGAPECPGDFTVGVISKIRPVEARDGNPLSLEPAPKWLKTGPGSGPNGGTNTAPIEFEYRVEFANMYEACHGWFNEKEIGRYDTSSGPASGLLNPSDWYSTYEPHGIDAEEHSQFSDDFYEHLMKHGAMNGQAAHCDALFDCHKTIENRSTQWPIVCPGYSQMRHVGVGRGVQE